MNTTNHKKLSEVGEKLLKERLEMVGRGDMRLGAMELGNWLTDVSQCVDRVAYAYVQGLAGDGVHAVRDGGKYVLDGADHFGDRVMDSVHGLFNRYRIDCPSWVDWPHHMADKGIAKLREKLDGVETALMKALQIVFADGGPLERGFRATFQFVGFYKHAYPQDQKGTFRIDPKVYFHIFEQRYTEYLPHEHLDRAEQAAYRVNPKKAPQYPTETSRNLYAYLREDFEYVSGLLAMLDGGHDKLEESQASWAEATFSKGKETFWDAKKACKVDDKDPDWNLHLALLGHALHCVEDYFAHSNFLEHASLGLPGYCRVERAEDENVGPDRTGGDWNFGGPHIVARRLKKWCPNYDERKDDWRKLKQELDVTTGYFDFFDTANSLVHAVDEAFGRPNEKVGRKIDDTWTALTEYEYRKLLTDSLELFETPVDTWKANRPNAKGFDEDKQNLAVKLIRDKLGTGIDVWEGNSKELNTFVTLMIDGPLANQPPEIKKAYRESMNTLCKPVGGLLMANTVYGLIQKLVEFFTAPGKFLLGFAKDLGVEFLEVYLKNAVSIWLGAQRIGSHSLIAKDCGPEIFFNGGMECARAVHWYVVHTLTRHVWEAPKPVNRVGKNLEQKKQKNVIALRPYIDWLELVEWWLDHPLARDEVKKGVVRRSSGPIRIVTRKDPHSIMSPDSLVTLANEYRPTYDGSANKDAKGHPKPFTWETIADANFPVGHLTGQPKARAINAILRHAGQGIPVSDGVNLAFKPGLSLTIPFQIFEEQTFVVDQIERRWWYPVLVGPQKHKSVIAWFGPDGKLVKDAPVYVHRPRFLTRDEHRRFVAKGDAKRQELERRYRDLRSTKRDPAADESTNLFASPGPNQCTMPASTNMSTTAAADPNGWWKRRPIEGNQ